MNKTELRKHYKSVRNNIPQNLKSEYDCLIFSSFVNSAFSSDYDLYLCYISVNSEVDTYNIINFLLSSGKRVAVPFCDEKTMKFYEIKSVDDFIIGAFGIPTVDCSHHTVISDFENALCIVPALSFDNEGNRLGYGGGFYDRFLSEKKIKTLGLCYEECISSKLPSEDYDMKIDFVLTEKSFKLSKIKEASTYE